MKANLLNAPKIVYPVALVFSWLLLLGLSSCNDKAEIVPIISQVTPPSDGVGTRVEIAGMHFGSSVTDATVDFNGTPATIESVADTLIITQVPEGATSGKISVTIQGRRGSSSDDFVVLPGQWVLKSEFPGEKRFRPVTFSINGKAYVGAGTNSFVYFKDFYRYDPGADHWTQVSSLPGPARVNATVFVIGTKAYVGLGEPDGADGLGDLNDFYSYDPDADQWATIASFPDGGREMTPGFSIGDQGYVALGETVIRNDSFVYDMHKDVWDYDPGTDSWAKLTDDFPGQERDWSAGIGVGSFAYIGLGSYTSDFWRYDPSNNSWQGLADLPKYSDHQENTAVLDGKIFVVGSGAHCWMYDPASDTWQQYPSLPGSAVSTSVFSVGENLFVITVYYPSTQSGELKNDLYEFSLTTQ